jgi:hypothetical protein
MISPGYYDAKSEMALSEMYVQINDGAKQPLNVEFRIFVTNTFQVRITDTAVTVVVDKDNEIEKWSSIPLTIITNTNYRFKYTCSGTDGINSSGYCKLAKNGPSQLVRIDFDHLASKPTILKSNTWYKHDIHTMKD